MPDLRQALKDLVETSNSGKYADEATLMSKFPELKGYDIGVLKDFVATANGGQYATEDELFAKFPEFNLGGPVPQVKKNSQLPLVSGSQGSAPTEELAVGNMGITGLQKVKTPVPVAAPTQADTPKAAPLQTKAPQFVTDLTSSITPEEISKQEETLVPEMNYKYGPLGFKFEEAGYTGNYMKVVAPNGKDAIEVSLGLGSMDKKGEAEKLKRFIEENSNTVSTGKLLAVEQEYKNNKKVYNSQKEIDETVKNLNKEAEGLMAAQKVWAKQQDEYNVQVDKFNKVPVSERTTPQYKQQYDALIKQRNELDAKRVELTSGLDDITYKEETLKESVGRYTEMESQKGAWYETVPMALARGAGKLASGFYGEAMDLINEFGPRDMLGVNDEWWEKQSLKSAKKLGYGEPSEGQNATQFLYNLPSQQKSNVEADVRDVLKKRDKGFIIGGEANDPKYLKDKFIELAKQRGLGEPKSKTTEAYVSWLNTLSDDVKDEIDVEVKKQAQGGQTISEVLRNTLSDVLPTVSTKEYYEKTQQKFVPGAVLGAIESVPAFMFGNKFTRLARLFAQADDATFAEMEKDPDFKDISENEKRLISTPISIATAILEEVGFRNIISNKGLLNRITLAALRKSGATTTAKTFGELVRNEVDGMVAKGALTLVGASLAEAETGALQQVADIAVKEIYNEVKDKKMFNTPESVGEFVADVVKAGVQEAIGGFVLGTPSAVGAAYAKKGFLNMSDEQFRQFESMANDGKLQTAFVTSLKNKILNGEISRSEAKQQLNDYRNSVSLYNQLPDDLSLQGKKEAMNLIKEKNALKQQIEGKDDALVVKQKERIAAIDAELGEISNTKSVTNFNEEETGQLAWIINNEIKYQENEKGSELKKLLGMDVRSAALVRIKKEFDNWQKWEGKTEEYSNEEIENENEIFKLKISLIERSLDGAKPITLNQIRDNAIQEQGAATSVPSTEQPQLGLQEMGEGNAQPQGTPPGTQEVVAPEQEQEEVVPVVAPETEVANPLENVESTAKALEGLNTAEIEAPLLQYIIAGRIVGKTPNQVISEEYHKAKQDGSNPELVTAVEQLVSSTTQPAAEVAPATTTETATITAPEITAEPVAEPVVEPVVEEEPVAEYEPVLVKDTSHDTFTRDNATDYEEGERESDNGRTYTYLAMVKVPLYDADGNTIGYLIKLTDDDNELSWKAEDIEQNELPAEYYDTKGEARQAIVDDYNKKQKKEFDKQAKKAARQKIKDAAKAAEKAAKAAAKVAEKAAKAAAKAAATTTAPTTTTETAPTTTTETVVEAPVVTVEEEVRQLEELFPEETQEPAVEGTEEAQQTTQEGVSVTGSELNELKSRIKDAVKLRIIEAAQRAAKTLKSLFPNIQIVVHETEESYNAYMDKIQLERGGAGTFSYSWDDNGATLARIDINLSKANARTVAHEATHAVLLKTFGDNVELFKKFQKRISSILSEGTNKELLKFANRYVDSNGNLLDVAYEEYLAELNAVLAENGSSMPVTMLQKIAALINKVVSTATNGMFTPFQNTKDTKDLIDFFNAASKNIREGGEFNNLNNLGVEGVLTTSGVRGKKSLVAEKIRSRGPESDISAPQRGANETIPSGVNEKDGLKIKGKSQKVFRGSGRNMGSGVNEGFNWVSSSREVAEDFGDVTELEIPTPQKTYKFPWARTSQPITGDQLVNAVNNAIIKAIKEKTLTESQYRAINEKKKLLSTLIDNKIDSFQSKVNDPKSSKLLAEIFSDLGYDALEVNDGGITNYGLIKATPNNIKAKSQKSEITFERGVGRKSIKVNLNNIEVTPVREVNFEDEKRWHTFEITHEGEKLGSIDLKRKGDDVKIALSVIFSPKENEKSIIELIKAALKRIITKAFKGNKGAFIITKVNEGKGIGTVAYTKLAEMLQQEYGKKLISDSTRSDAAEALWRSFERKGLAKVVGNRDSSQYNWEYYYEFIVKPTPTNNIKGKFQLTTVEKITNIINQARGRGFSEASIATFLNNKGYSAADITSAMSVAGATPTLNEQTNEGFDALMQKVDKRIAKMRSQPSTATEAQIITAIDTIIRNSPLYATLNDQQKKFLELEGRNRTNARERRAPSIGRVLGVLSDITNISRAEKLLVIKRIRDLSKDAAKNLAMELRNMASTGTITLPQAANVLARFGKVNLLNEVSVANFVDYMARVFADAEYAAKMKYAKSMLASAKKNVTSKIGIADGLITPLIKLFSVNPSIIPDSVLDKYISLVKMFGEKAAVLTLREKSDVLADVNDILQILDQEQSLVDTLLDVVEQYQNKEFDANGNLDLEKTIKNMIDDGAITEDDAVIMRKYRTTFVPRASTKKTQQELDDEKNELLDALDNITVDGSGLTTRDERKLANEIGELIKTSAVRSLSNTELKNLLKVIDNINNNYITNYAEVIKEKMNGINKEKPLVSSIKRSVLPTLSKVVANIKNIVTRKKNATLTMIERNPLIYLDQVFGDFKTQDLYNSLLLDASIGDAAYKSQLKVVQEILEKAEQKVAESFGLKKNETLMSKYKMMTYMIQLEYLSNPDNEQVNEAAKYINETIKFIESSDASRYTDRDVKMLEDILSEFAPNGEVDINKLYATFNSAEKAAIDTIRNLNESLREKAEFTAAIIRGDRISPLNNYVHLNVLQDPTQRDAASSSPSDIANMSNMMNPSTKAKSLIKRTKGAKALNFDIFASAQRGAKFVLMDYNLTSPIRTARITLNNAKKALEVNGRIPKEERDKINALESAFRRAVENLLLNSFTNSSTGEEIIDYISKTGYRAVLAGTTRFISELTSNIGFALITDPKAMSEGVKHMKLMMSEDALLVLQNVLSTQITRIIPTASLSGSMIDTSILRQSSGIRGGRATNSVANRINQLWNRSGKKYVNSVEFVADNLISTADKVIMRPMWFGSFANEFKAETGLSPDFDMIAQNDEAYMEQYKEAIKNAKTVADGRVVLTGATDNAFMGVLKGTAKIDDGVTKKAFNNFNNYMTKFLIFEYITARTGINAAMGNGMITRRQGIALIAGVTTRMVVYTFLAQLMGTGLMGLLFGGDDEEEDEKSLAQKFGQQVVSAFTSLMFGRDFGQGVRGILNIGLEEFNKEFLDGLREGEYDPYKDAIQYSIIPPERKGRQTDLGDLFLNMSGSFGPAMKTADFIVRKGFEAPKKEEEAIERTKNEIAIRIPLELAGNAGLIPLYKDVRKVVMNELYKDLRLADKRAADKKRAAEEKLQGYKNSEDMKRYAPELWKETFGPNSAGYDVNEAKKRIKREKAKIERERKDELYNYTPNKRGSKSSFGTQGKRKSSFGSENKSGARTFGRD